MNIDDMRFLYAGYLGSLVPRCKFDRGKEL